MKKLGKLITELITIRSFLIGWGVFMRSIILWIAAAMLLVILLNGFTMAVDFNMLIKSIIMIPALLLSIYLVYPLSKWALRSAAKKYNWTVTSYGKAMISIAWRWMIFLVVIGAIFYPVRFISFWLVGLVFYTIQFYVIVASLGWSCEKVINKK